MLKQFCYAPLYLFLWLHSLLPLRLLYILSDLLYYPLYYVVKYRRTTVQGNLAKAYPRKSEQERKQLERNFYHHFCDIVVETIKLMHISDQEMKRRMEFKNIELLEEQVAQGNSCIALLGHYGNWEWIPSITLWLPQGVVHFAQIYRPLTHAWFDQFFLKLRSRFGSVSIRKNETLRKMLSFRSLPIPTVTGFIADQTPSVNAIHYWANFLGQPTPMLTGGEIIARKLRQPVFYIDVERRKRGYYTATLRPVSLTPQESREFEITQTYATLMEQTIQRDPSQWLWTHNRWKHAARYSTTPRTPENTPR